MAKEKKKSGPAIDMKVYGVLSYPNVHEPKANDEGKIVYRTDVLFEKDDPQLAILKKKINSVRVKAWGEDKTEWPKKAKTPKLKDGDEKQDQPTYEGKTFISVNSNQPVSIINKKGEDFPTNKVKGGMHAWVAIRICTFDNKFGEGLSVYLQSIMIDQSKKPLEGFGGGKSAQQHFADLIDKDDDSDDSDDEDADEAEEEEENEEDEDELPRAKKAGKKKAASFMDEDDD